MIMFRNWVLADLFVLWIVIGAPAFAQTNNGVSGIGHDYFTADQDGVGDYMRIMTGAHVATIPRWLDEGRIGNAIADLQYTLERFPNHPEALLYMGLVARITKNPGLAFTYYQNALTQYPQYAITHFQYGQFLLRVGDVDKAIEALKRSIAIDPKWAGGHAGLAHAYAKKGDMVKAREATDKARELGYTGQLPPGL
jgi:tetratricopeptide (TPR) repeat protein